ncbi:hypothetical protein Ae201684P_002368 [Aphanomyces euteiches]|nr:hypothetical protein Ae201684P_002368 [Aphanomyces euteiches]
MRPKVLSTLSTASYLGPAKSSSPPSQLYPWCHAVLDKKKRLRTVASMAVTKTTRTHTLAATSAANLGNGKLLKKQLDQFKRTQSGKVHKEGTQTRDVSSSASVFSATPPSLANLSRFSPR